MKRERIMSPKKSKKSKKLSSSSESSSSENEIQYKASPSKQNKKNNTANIKVRLQNTDTFAMYRNKNQHLSIEQMEIPSNFLPSEIDEDDDIWLCEIPNVVNVNELIGKTIKLGGSKTLTTSDGIHVECASEKYDDSNNVYQNTLSMAIKNSDSQFSMTNVKALGRLTFRQKLNEYAYNMNDDAAQISYKAGTTFPKDIHIRHPLHGHQFEKHIDLNEAIKQKLKDAQGKSSQKHTKLKLKKEKEINCTSVEAPNKKSKKRKADTNVEHSVEAKKIKTENVDEDLAWIKQL